MPELAASYLVGTVVTLLLLSILLAVEWKVLKSKSYQQLQQNLAQKQLRWSDSMDKVVGIDEKEGFSFISSMTIFGFFCAFLSWLGLLFLILIYCSIKLLTKSPRKKMLQSRLGNEKLTEQEIAIMLVE